MTTTARLIPGNRSVISVIMFGQRTTIARSWYDKVMWLANCSTIDYEIARHKRLRGELCELDDDYWVKSATLRDT